MDSSGVTMRSFDQQRLMLHHDVITNQTSDVLKEDTLRRGRHAVQPPKYMQSMVRYVPTFPAQGHHCRRHFAQYLRRTMDHYNPVRAERRSESPVFKQTQTAQARTERANTSYFKYTPK